jgi:hypothetical protein
VTDTVIEVLEQPSTPIEVTDTPATVIEVLDIGLQGPPGSGNGSFDVIGTAATNLGGQRVVYLAADGMRYGTANDPITLDVIGITVGSASVGAAVVVRSSGPMTDPTFNFTPGPIFLGLNGLLTQVSPSTGGAIIIGNALSANTMLIRIHQTLELI